MIKKFRNFQLGIGFFSNFPKKIANVPKLRTFIYSELHLSEVWARSEDLFFRKKRPLLEGVFDKKFQKFQKGIGFFFNFLKKSRMFQNCAHLFPLNFIWANFEQDLRHFFFEKKGLCSGGNLKKKSKNFPNFKLKIDFFLILQKKPPMFQNIRNLFVLNFIWANFQQN